MRNPSHLTEHNEESFTDNGDYFKLMEHIEEPLTANSAVYMGLSRRQISNIVCLAFKMSGVRIPAATNVSRFNL